MKSIEDIKTELVLKMLQGPLKWQDIEKLPKNDELRTFICQFKAEDAYLYAHWVDEGPHPETRTAACKDPDIAYRYALHVDKAPTEETRIAASKDPYWVYKYAYLIGETSYTET